MTRRGPADIRPSRTTQIVVLVVVGLVFAIPIVAMVEFSLRAGLTGGLTLDHWATVLGGRMPASYQRPLVGGILNSLLIAALTAAIVLVLLVPTQVLVHLRFPRLRRVLEFVCLLPITIPAIVLVVGLAPIYSVLARMFGSGAWTLCFAYGILVLPYAYRAIQSNLTAVDLHTLTEASRTLGANWLTTLWTVVLPNIRRGLVAASFITVAVVLGEYTIALLLNRQNLQTSIVQISKFDPFAPVIVALLALAFGFVLLLVLGRVSAPRRRK